MMYCIRENIVLKSFHMCRALPTCNVHWRGEKKTKREISTSTNSVQPISLPNMNKAVNMSKENVNEMQFIVLTGI
jgi:hypothetical protein